MKTRACAFMGNGCERDSRHHQQHEVAMLLRDMGAAAQSALYWVVMGVCCLVSVLAPCLWGG